MEKMMMNNHPRSSAPSSTLRQHAAFAAGIALASGALAQPSFLFTLIPDDRAPSMAFSTGMDMRDGIIAASGDVTPGVYLFDAQTGQQIRKIPVANAEFTPVAVGGGFVATSYPSAEVNGVFSAGTILIFDTDTGQQVHALTLGDAQPLDLFGTAMAIQGSTMIASAISGESFLFPSNRASGAAFIFDLSTGAQIATLVPSDSAPGDRFGVSVAIDGDTTILGAVPSSADGPQPAAYIFRESAPGTWVEVAKIDSPDVADFDTFGDDVDLEGDVAVVGRSSDDQLGANAGAAFIYREIAPGDWQLVTKLTASDPAQTDRFGASVAISDGLVVVGATEADPSGVDEAGKVYVFEEMPDGSWVETTILTQNTPNELARFGWNVVLDQDALAIAVPADDNAGDRSGAVYVYEIGGAPACPPDLDADGDLDADDFFDYLDLFASGDPAADLTGEGLIDADDFFEYLTLFAAGCP